MENQPITRRQRRILERAERQKSQQQSAGRGRSYTGYVIGGVIMMGVILAAWYGLRPGPASVGDIAAESAQTTYTAGPVHWHAAVDVQICGQHRDLPKDPSGESGIPLLHQHNDNIIHIEGRVLAKEDIAIGKFFDAINVPFDQDKIMDKNNGDECAPGKPGAVKMFVNDQPSNEFRNYIPIATENAQEDRIRISFE